MKIGIVSTFGSAEARKNELIDIKYNSPKYLKNIPKKYLRSFNNKKGYPYDIVIGYYIMDKFPNVTVNFISPNNLSKNAFKANVLNFMLIYDILEAMNLTDSGLLIKRNHPNNDKAASKLVNALKIADNVFPPYEYQKLINSKCAYYKWMKNNKIPITPTICITTDTKKKFIRQMIKSIEELSLSNMFFTKPDGGQESIGGRKWIRGDYPDYITDRGGGESHYRNNTELIKKMGIYYDTVGTKFPRIILQKYQQGFDEIQDEETDFKDVSPENRTFFVGDEYQYTVTTDFFCFRQPKTDGGQKKFLDCDEKLAKRRGLGNNVCHLASSTTACNGPQVTKQVLERTKTLARQTMDILPEIKIKGKVLPKLLTRVDVGIISKKYNKKQPIFVNEVEFVPSLFHKYVLNKKIYEKLGDQIVNITNIFLNQTVGSFGKTPTKIPKKKILILKLPGITKEPIYRSCRPWLKGNKQDYIGHDYSIAEYLKYTYGDKLEVHYKNPYKTDFNYYDKIWFGTEWWSGAILLDKVGKQAETKFIKYIKQIPKHKLLIPTKFLQDAYNKCLNAKIMKKLKIKTAPTMCIPIKNLDPNKVLNKLKRKKWNKVYIKPIPGHEAKSNFIWTPHTHKEELFEYFKKVKNFDQLVFQKFMCQFCTQKYPELKTYWVGHTYHLTAKAAVNKHGLIEYAGVSKRLNKNIRNQSLKIIKYLEKRYNYKNDIIRIDWGYDKISNGYFFNEIEILPGMFSEEINDDKGRCSWMLDKSIGDRISELVINN